MPVPSDYRWVSVGGLTVSTHGNRPEGVDLFNLADVIDALHAELELPRGRRLFRNRRMKMWVSHLNTNYNEEFYVFFIHAANKDVVPGIYSDFNTEEVRQEEIRDGEGAWYSSHVLLKKASDRYGRHEIFVEKLPHISFGNITTHFNWIMKLPNHIRSVQAENEEHSYFAKISIAGLPSSNLQTALEGGRLVDLQMVKRGAEDGGLDEDDQFKDVTKRTTFKVQNAVSFAKAKAMLATVLKHTKAELKDDGILPELLLRLETAGQERTTSLEYDPQQLAAAEDEDLEDIATGLLVGELTLNERIGNFAEPLGQAHHELVREVVQKLIERRNILALRA